MSTLLKVHSSACILNNNTRPVDKRVCEKKPCLISKKNQKISKIKNNLLKRNEQLKKEAYRWNATEWSCKNCTIQNHIFTSPNTLVHTPQNLYQSKFNNKAQSAPNSKTVPNRAHWQKIFEKTQNHNLKLSAMSREKSSTSSTNSTLYLRQLRSQRKLRKSRWQRRGNFSYILG